MVFIFFFKSVGCYVIFRGVCKQEKAGKKIISPLSNVKEMNSIFTILFVDMFWTVASRKWHVNLISTRLFQEQTHRSNSFSCYVQIKQQQVKKHLATCTKSDFLIIRKNHRKLDYSWAICCTYKAPSTCSPPIHSCLEWWLVGWLVGWRGQWHYSPLMQQVAAPFWHTVAFSLKKNQRIHGVSEKHCNYITTAAILTLQLLFVFNRSIKGIYSSLSMLCYFWQLWGILFHFIAANSFLQH